MLQKHLSSVRYLARQGLALCDHEKSEGSMMQMWFMHDADIQQWLKDGKYLSRDVVNEHIKIMSDNVLLEILSVIKSGNFWPSKLMRHLMQIIMS